jgi:WD40 repeat protein
MKILLKGGILMKTKFTCFLFVLSFLSGLVFAQDAGRGLVAQVKNLDKDYRVGKQYLVLIAIDKYQEWQALRNPVRDAREIREILAARYYLDKIFELYDGEATKANILMLFDNLQQTLRTEDSVLIFYAGHGLLDRVSNTGFWIPANGGTNSFEQANWIPNAQLRGLIGGFKTTHVLLISDSCFSGDILSATRGSMPVIDTTYFRKAYGLISRQVLTSGASETVPDESEFTRMLKLVLTKNEKPYLDPLMIYSEVRLGMKATLPLLGSLKDTGHQEGASFLLFLKPESERGEGSEARNQADSLENDLEKLAFSTSYYPAEGNLLLPSVSAESSININCAGGTSSTEYALKLQNQGLTKYLSYNLIMASAGKTGITVQAIIKKANNKEQKLGEDGFVLEDQHYLGYMGYIPLDPVAVQNNDTLILRVVGNGDDFGILHGPTASVMSGIVPANVRLSKEILDGRKQVLTWILENNAFHSGDMPPNAPAYLLKDNVNGVKANVVYQIAHEIDYLILNKKNGRWIIGSKLLKTKRPTIITWQNNLFTAATISAEEAKKLDLNDFSVIFERDRLFVINKEEEKMKGMRIGIGVLLALVLLIGNSASLNADIKPAPGKWRGPNIVFNVSPDGTKISSNGGSGTSIVPKTTGDGFSRESFVYDDVSINLDGTFFYKSASMTIKGAFYTSVYASGTATAISEKGTSTCDWHAVSENLKNDALKTISTNYYFGVYCMALSPDGKYALAGFSWGVLTLWNVATGKEVRTFSGHDKDIEAVTFSSDGRYALSGSRDNTIKLWDVASGKEIRTFTGHSEFVNAVAFSPDRKYLISGADDKTLKLWEVASGKELRTFSGHADDINSVTFSPDGKYTLSGADDKTLKLWEVATGKEVRTFFGHSDRVLSVAFSPDGKYALSGSVDNNLKLWDVASGKELRTFSGHADAVNSVKISPNGKYALSGSRDATLKLWELETGKELRTLNGHYQRVTSVAFSPDGKYALSASGDDTLKLWDVTVK